MAEDSREGVREEVAAAAAEIVEAFRSGDEERYFAGFAPECTFAFHTDRHILLGRDEWRAEWREMTAAGWRVVDCRSLVPHVQPVGADGGVFLHELETTAEQGGVRETYRERETIVFARRDGRLTAVHEHLSPVPEEREVDAAAAADADGDVAAEDGDGDVAAEDGDNGGGTAPDPRPVQPPAPSSPAPPARTA